jgi:hypothetical protein
MPTRKFSDAAKSALLFILICLILICLAVEACSERVRNVFGTQVAAVLVADESASERLNLLEQNHTS